MNKVILVGYTGTIDVGQSGSSQTYSKLSVGTTEKWVDGVGSIKQKTIWHKVYVFGGIAKTTGDWPKGTLIEVIGKLHYYERKDQGVIRMVAFVEAEKINVIRFPSGHTRIIRDYIIPEKYKKQ